MISLNILTPGILLKNWQKSYFHKPLIAIFLFFLILSGLIDFFPIKNDHFYTVDDYPKLEIAQDILRLTEPESVFLTTTYLYNPASLAGRKTYIDYGYFAWSLGYKDRERRQLLPLFFSQQVSLEKICQLYEQEGIDYLLISPGQNRIEGRDPRKSQIVQQASPLIQTMDNYQLYDINQICRQSKI